MPYKGASIIPWGFYPPGQLYKMHHCSYQVPSGRRLSRKCRHLQLFTTYNSIHFFFLNGKKRISGAHYLLTYWPKQVACWISVCHNISFQVTLLRTHRLQPNCKIIATIWFLQRRDDHSFRWRSLIFASKTRFSGKFHSNDMTERASAVAGCFSTSMSLKGLYSSSLY